MANHKQATSIVAPCLFVLFAAFLINGTLSVTEYIAKQNWQNIDQQLKDKVFQLNIGLKMRLRNSLWVQVADISSKEQYYVFTTNLNDRGYQVVGRGSAFPIFANTAKKIYFVTNNHVLDNTRQIKEECEMFYAATAFYATRSVPSNNKRFEELLNIINLVNKKECSATEKKLYRKTVNAIWDCYDNYLSKQVDPTRKLFNQYRQLAPIQVSANYFLHAPGPITQAAIEAKVYKRAKSKEADLALLVAEMPPLAKSDAVKSLQIDNKNPVQGEEIQVIGYPLDETKSKQRKYYCPTFNSGKITKVGPHMFEFDASISKGDSGGPVINNKGNVLGIVTTRAVTQQGIVLPNCGGAISIKELKFFVPELFSR